QAKRNPYAGYRHMRDEHPVALLEGRGWYALTRHADVERVLRCPGEFSSTVMRSADRALLGQDPPAHTRLRKIVAGAFNARRLRALEGDVESTARSLVGGFAKKGGGDFVREVSEQLPIRIITRLLGIDEDRRCEVKEWSQAVILGASRMISAGDEVEH